MKNRIEIPAEAGIQKSSRMDPRFHGDFGSLASFKMVSL